MPFANFMIANSAGAVAWALFYGLGAYHLGKRVEELARPFLGDLNSCFGQSDVEAAVKRQRISVPIANPEAMVPPSIAPNSGKGSPAASPAHSGSARFRFSSLDVPPSPRLPSQLVRRERVAQLPQQRQLRLPEQ
jgi:hypothetical protein